MAYLGRALILLILSASLLSPAKAQGDYPSRPIKIVVPWLAGGFNDILARYVAEHMTKRMGQPVLVENKPGATGTMGSEGVARAAADGYTLLMATADTHAISVAVMSKLRYDPIKDFDPVSLLVAQPVVLWAGPRLPVSSFAEFIALAKQKNGQLTYASIGTGSTTHLGMESLKKEAGIELVHVPYKGSSAGMIDIVGGQVDVGLYTYGSIGNYAKDGQMRPLAVTSAKRYPFAPEIPTVAELGFPGFELSLWNGLVAPRGTPPAIIDRLYRELQAIMSSAETKEKFSSFGVEPITSTPAEFKAFIGREVERWKSVAREANVKLD